MNKNSPLHTILKIKKFSNLTYKNPIYINQFENKDIKNLPKRDRYYGVFMEITGYFEKSKFYREVFLPRMDERKAFMRMNRKFTQLTQEEFEEQKKKLQIKNKYDEYSSRQDIPLFTYITNDPDQFENWSAIRIFEWWRNLRMSGIEKQNWDVFDSVKYLFINQFMRIMNSYLKYGVDRRDKLAFTELQKYLELVDVFYESGGQYQHLLNAHLAFCEWFSARFIGGLLFESGRNNVQKYVNSRIYSNEKRDKYKKLIIDYFSLTCKNNNGILVIPLSFFQKESNFINIYTGPFIVFLGINYRTHYGNIDFNELYSPYGQIYHDFKFHAEILIWNYNKLYNIDVFNKPTNLLQKDDILLFKERCKFLTIVSLTKNDEFKKLLWYILHETPIYFFTSANSFFNISILFIKLNEIINIKENNKFRYIFHVYSVDSIYTLICACIVFFMFEFLELNIIQKISITVDGSTTTVSFDGIPLVILEIRIESKYVNILYINPEIESFINLSALFERTGFQFILIIRSKNNNNKVKRIFSELYYKKMRELQQAQPK
jgi:hypothetical protein